MSNHDEDRQALFMALIHAGQIVRYFGKCENCEGDAMFGLTPYVPAYPDYEYAHDEVYECATCGFLYGFDEAPSPYTDGNEEVF